MNERDANPVGPSSDAERTALELALPADLPPEVLELAKTNPQVRDAVRIVAEQYRGPIPHPRTLKEFDQIVPGSARDLIDDFKAWGALNRTLLERQANGELQQDAADRSLAFRGQVIAVILVVFFGIPGIVRIFQGDTVGGALLLAPALLGGLARLFIAGRSSLGAQESADSSTDAQGQTPKKP
jgi:uncharacterized membrane protein